MALACPEGHSTTDKLPVVLVPWDENDPPLLCVVFHPLEE